MGRVLGSTSAHQAMNDRMRLMIGEQGEQPMHQLMGARFAGCSTSGAIGGNGSMMGPGMMGGNNGNGGWGAMMGSSDWSWMMGSAWRNMPARIGIAASSNCSGRARAQTATAAGARSRSSSSRSPRPR
jgi:hypothetical protein